MHIGNYTHCIKEGGLVQVNDISLKCKQCILVIVNILKTCKQCILVIVNTHCIKEREERPMFTALRCFKGGL